MIGLLLILVLQSGSSSVVQVPFTVNELAQYRLSLPVFKQFAKASRLIQEAAHASQSLARDPLFTREVSVLGDAPIVAAELETRLKSDPVLAAALRASRISAHEYTKFALSLFAARLAHGFIKSGALRFVPAGIATDNVAFVEAHEPEITAVLQVLGLEGAQ